MTRPAEKRLDLVGPFDPLALAGKKPDVDRSSLDFVDRLGALTLDGAKSHAVKKCSSLPSLKETLAPLKHDVVLDDPDATRRTTKWARIIQSARKFFARNTPTKPTPAPPMGSIYPSSLLDTTVYPKAEAITAPLPAAVNAPTQPTFAVTPARPRSISAPFPARLAVAQCSGETRAGNRCSRQVKLPATYFRLDPIPDLFCFQHEVSIASQSGAYVRKPGRSDKYVEFSDYIPKYLQKKTQVALKVEMEKATSTADEPGFIYAFEIKDKARKGEIQLKVGRAVNLNKRLSDWDNQCAPKTHITRGWWPGIDDAGSLLKGNIKTGNPGPFCHRVERLVHLELGDLSLNAPYLNPKWPDIMPEDSPLKRAAKEKQCHGCGKFHREIFTFPRPNDGKYKENEWELIVKPVIEKWGRFVAEYYA